MSMIALWFKRTWLILGIAALGFGFMPLASAQALAPSNPTAAPTPTKTSGDRLAQAWVREQAIYNKLGTLFADVDQRIPRLQELINKAKAKGRDVSALQTALDNFSGAVKQAEPIYQSTSGTVASHPGFDANGNVTDQTQALTTVKDLGEKFKEIRQLISVPAKALRDAMQAFRSANSPSGTPAPTQSGG
jgi:hypothetical protein